MIILTGESLPLQHVKLRWNQREGESRTPERVSDSPGPCARVCGSGLGARGEENETHQSSSYVTVVITDVPTDSPCGSWAEA